MSALLVDDLLVPTRPEPARWHHIDRASLVSPAADSGQDRSGKDEGVVVTLPSVAEPSAFPAVHRPVGASWRLTDRGIALAVVLFCAVVALSLAVLVGAFLSVSDAPDTESVPAAVGQLK